MKKTNIDSPFYHTMGKIGDLLFANLLWLVCCLPIVTAGASTLGLFTVVNKMAAKEDYTVHTDFFKAFKRDFKQSTALWLVLLLAGFAALTGLRTATAQDTPSTGILGGSVLSAAGAGRLLRQLELCPAGTVHLSRRSAGAGGQRPHDPCKPAAHCGESSFSGVVSSAGKSRPCVVRLSAAPVAAHRRRRFCPWHGKPDAPRLCSAGKSRAQGRGTGRRT